MGTIYYIYYDGNNEDNNIPGEEKSTCAISV